jgi:hypothetical protein
LHLIASDGRFLLPHRHIHQPGDVATQVLRGDKRRFRRAIAWNDSPSFFHVQDVDPRMERSLPMWHTVVVQEPPVDDTGILQISLLESIDGFKCVLCQRVCFDVSDGSLVRSLGCSLIRLLTRGDAACRSLRSRIDVYNATFLLL